jgi:DNA repair exonuclease SbcCD ATPase subunit
MEKLSPDQQAEIKKLSTARLAAKLVKAGVDEETVGAMERTELMCAWAECVAEGRDRTGKPTGEAELRHTMFEFEKWKFEQEVKMRESERQERLLREEAERKRQELKEEEERKRQEMKEEEERKRQEMKEEEKKKRREAKEEEERKRQEMKEEEERKRREAKEEEERQRQEARDEVERKRWEAEREERRKAEELQLKELKVREAELERLTKRDEAEAAKRDSLASRSKYFADVLKSITWKFPQDAGDIPLFFEHLEGIFEDYDVPDDLKARLLQAQLSEKAKGLIARLTKDKTSSYAELKKTHRERI